MGFNIFQLKAQQSNLNFYDSQASLEDVMGQYHQYVNDTFNVYTKKMMNSLNENPNDPNGVPPEKPEQCQNLPPNSTGDANFNFSTFCLAVNLLGDTSQPNNQGYLNYKAALLVRKNEVFDPQEKDAWNKYIESVTLGKENTQKAQQAYQVEKLLTVSGRIEAVDREIKTSKTALDKTLAAYDQLRMAWPMHQQYVRIFNALTTYRDNLVDLRQQTDTFPSRFVDMTSNKCT